MKLTLVSKVVTARNIERVFQLTFTSADSYVTGGVALDFTKAVNTVNADRSLLPAYVGPGNNPPAASRFRMNQVPQGYDAEIVVNTSSPTIKNYLFYIFSSGGTQISASTVPSGIYGDVNGFTFSCVTPKQFG